MTPGVLVVGAGGHAKVCIEILRAAGHDVAICVGGSGSAETCVGVPVVVGDDEVDRFYCEGVRRAFVAIGDNRTRHRLALEMVARGFELVSAVSPSAVLSPSVHVDAGVAVMAGAVVNAESRLGFAAIVNTGATVDHDNVIGAGAHVAPRCGLAGNVTIGERTFLGVGTAVIPGRTIGADCIVGAGSLVLRDIPSSVVAYGAPATVRRESRPAEAM
jgi:UDP-perosamine 4-acetyltransferase